MKFSILQEHFVYGLSFASRTIANKTTLPVLSNVLLDAKNGMLRISGTNLEIGVTLTVGAKVEDEGSFTVPCRTLYEFVSSLPVGKVECELDGQVFKLSCASFKAEMNGIPASDFPPLVTEGKGVTYDLSSETFADAVNYVAFSSAHDEARPILTGVLLSFYDTTLEMVATDGYRLSVRKLTLPRRVEKDFKVIMPAKTLFEVVKVSLDTVKRKGKGDEGGDLSVTFFEDQKQALFKIGEVELMSRIIEGAFPNYQRIIPSGFTTHVVVLKEDLMRSVKVASIFARDSANIIRLVFDPTESSLTLSANAAGVGGQQSSVDGEITGEKNQIAFNSKYLTDFLSILTSEKVTLDVSGPLNPGVFKIEGEDNYLHVVMPVRVSEGN